MNDNSEEIVKYLQKQILTTDDRLKKFTHSLAGRKYPKRFLFVKLKQYINDFLEKISENKLVIVPGFRGVGKTTVVAQICAEFKNKGLNILFLSVEDAKNLFDVGINELLGAYEKILGENLESLKDPVLIFLDEVQVDPKWTISLKSLYEKTTKIFFCCTGSSAVNLQGQTTANLARRVKFEPMTPMCFGEYEMINKSNYPTPGLKEKIKQAIYFSENSQDVYNNLLKVESEVNNYWSRVDVNDIKKYLSYGSLPFSSIMPDEVSIYNSISLLVDKIIQEDMSSLGNFDSGTLGVVKRILFSIAENDTTSLTTLEKKFGISRLTIANIFDVLEKAELLIKIQAHGSNMNVVNKPNKYLFMSSAIRMSFFYFTGNESTYLTRQGKLLEDSVGGHLYREFVLRSNGAIRYDSAQGGADFILQIGNDKKIIIEAGLGNKDKKQVINTMKKVKSDYGIIFSKTNLSLDKETNIITIPLNYYFLM